jgi:hypothetical protein
MTLEIDGWPLLILLVAATAALWELCGLIVSEVERRSQR